MVGRAGLSSKAAIIQLKVYKPSYDFIGFLYDVRVLRIIHVPVAILIIGLGIFLHPAVLLLLLPMMWSGPHGLKDIELLFDRVSRTVTLNEKSLMNLQQDVFPLSYLHHAKIKTTLNRDPEGDVYYHTLRLVFDKDALEDRTYSRRNPFIKGPHRHLVSEKSDTIEVQIGRSISVRSFGKELTTREKLQPYADAINDWLNLIDEPMTPSFELDAETLQRAEEKVFRDFRDLPLTKHELSRRVRYAKR